MSSSTSTTTTATSGVLERRQVWSRKRVTSFCGVFCVLMSMIAVILSGVAIFLDTLSIWNYTVQLDNNFHFVTEHKFDFETEFRSDRFQLVHATYEYYELLDKLVVEIDDIELKYSYLCDLDGTSESIMTGSDSDDSEMVLMDTDYACDLQTRGELWEILSIVTIVIGIFAVLIGIFEQCYCCSKCRDGCPLCWDQFGRFIHIFLCFLCVVSSYLSMHIWFEGTPLDEFDHDIPASESGFEYYDETVAKAAQTSVLSDYYDYYYSSSVEMFGLSIIFMLCACCTFCVAACGVCCLNTQEYYYPSEIIMSKEIVSQTEEVDSQPNEEGTNKSVAVAVATTSAAVSKTAGTTAAVEVNV